MLYCMFGRTLGSDLWDQQARGRRRPPPTTGSFAPRVSKGLSRRHDTPTPDDARQLPERMDTAALAERTRKISEQRALKRQHQELEAQKAVLESALASVNENLEVS